MSLTRAVHGNVLRFFPAPPSFVNVTAPLEYSSFTYRKDTGSTINSQEDPLSHRMVLTKFCLRTTLAFMSERAPITPPRPPIIPPKAPPSLPPRDAPPFFLISITSKLQESILWGGVRKQVMKLLLAVLTSQCPPPVSSETSTLTCSTRDSSKTSQRS